MRPGGESYPMSKFVAYLDRIPYSPLIIAALILAVMPLGQPHLIEKLRMLFSGTLKRPLDWFDLFMHGAPLLLLLLKVIVTVKK